MGRIAEALKRAQAERAKLLNSGADPAAVACAPDPGGAVGTGAIAGDSFLTPSPTDSARPFPITAGVIPPHAVGPEVLVLHQPSSLVTEKYRSIRTRLLTADAGGTMRLLGVTSAAPKEGKTVSLANLAFSLAELKHLRVLMLDLDLRKRGLSRLVSAVEEPGICEVLRGERTLADVCRPVVRPNLYVVTAGDPKGASASDLLAGPTPAEVFKQIQERFQYALIDTPAAAVADIGLIAPLCHAVLMVIRMNSTPEPVVRRSVQMLQANRVPIAGCILTSCRDEIGCTGGYLGGA